MKDVQKVCFEIDGELWHKFKLQAFTEGKSIKEVIAEVIEKWLKQKGDVI